MKMDCSIRFNTHNVTIKQLYPQKELEVAHWSEDKNSLKMDPTSFHISRVLDYASWQDISSSKWHVFRNDANDKICNGERHDFNKLYRRPAKGQKSLQKIVLMVFLSTSKQLVQIFSTKITNDDVGCWPIA